ncbi:MAG: DNA methyltransferase [Fusobacteriaceae bacterium]
MNKEKFKSILTNILKNDGRLWTEENELDQIQLVNLLDKYDENILKIFLSNENIKESFFVKIGESYVFKHSEFKFYIEEHSPLANSYSEYINRIGLASGKRYLKDSDDIVLNFPFKDCILEGGQSSDEGIESYFEFYEKVDGEKTPELIGKNEHVVVSERKGAIKTVTGYELKQSKRKEVFYNEVLAKDEIDRLLDKKALTNWKRYTKEGIKEVEEIKKDAEGTIRENLIIKGNNLLALHSLKENFTGKVKLIYIDPPYNTGSDSFAYNDKFNHSTWLTFMKNRLEVAKELLRDDGIIFVQCDDNEQAYLKVLMDELYGRESFINNVALKVSPLNGVRISHATKTIIKEKEWIICYSKSSKIELNPQYIANTEWDDHYNSFIENMENPIDEWNVVSLKQKLKELSLKPDLENKKFVSWL